MAALVATGCGASPAQTSTGTSARDPSIGTEPPATDAPGTTVSSTTSVAPSPDEVEVRSVLDRFWPAYLEALGNPAPDNPALQDLLRGEAAVTTLGRFEDMARSGQRAEPPAQSVFSRHVMTVAFPEPDRALVRECLHDDYRVVQDMPASPSFPDGATVVLDDEVVTAEITTILARDDEGWHITSRDTSERLQGVRDCELFSP